MPLKAKLFITIMIMGGAGCLIPNLFAFYSEDLTRFAFLLVATIVGSGLKVSLPGVTGSMSVYFLFLLIGIVQLTLPETLIMGLCATLMQSIWNARKPPTYVQMLFNISSTSLAVWFAHLVFYRWEFLHNLRIGPLLLLGIASLVYFVINTGSVALVIAFTENKSARKVWNQCYFWFFPYYLIGSSIACLFEVTSKLLGWEAAMLILPSVSIIYRSHRLYLERIEAEKAHAEEMASLHLRTIEALALAIDAKDVTTGEHLQRVQVYAVEIGKQLGLVNGELEALRAAAILHDIGKLAVPEHIISKPGKLTPEEFEKMKIHPIVGAEILERVKFPYQVVPIVRAHHEKWNGTGYPYGLKGEEIPIGARILAAVDCLDALASDRQYRRALPLEEAMAMVVAESGKSYDPVVITILQDHHLHLEHSSGTVTLTDHGRLSRDIRVENGAAPDAGFDTGGARRTPDPPPVGGDFLTSIAAARQEAQTLFEMVQSLGNSLSLDETLSVLASRLRRLVPFHALAIYMVKDRKLIPRYVTGEDYLLFSSLEIPMGQGLSGWVAENNKPILNGNPSVEPGYLNDPAKFSTLKSAICAPLVGTSGVIGVLALYRGHGEEFSRDQLRILQVVNSKLSVAIENSMRFKQAEDSATTDFLTGLPNARSLFLHLDGEIARCGRSGGTLAVLVCDLDNFKLVNDRFGHLTGNRVLTLVAEALRHSCRGYDYVARMGGDEFVMILPNCTTAAAHQKIGELREMATRVSREVCGVDLLALSAGDAYWPADGRSAEELLVEADRRMYKQKQSHKRAERERAAAAEPALEIPAAC